MSDDLIRRLLSHHHMSQGDSFACLLATGREAAAELTSLRAQVAAADKMAEAGEVMAKALIGNYIVPGSAKKWEAALSTYEGGKE